MRLQVSVATIRPEHVEAVEAAGRRLFAAVAAAAPADFRYAVVRLGDGTTYVTLLQLPAGRNPLLDLPEFHDFMAGFPGWVAGPTPTGDHLVGDYRLFAQAT
jgi:hypothetical protein